MIRINLYQSAPRPKKGKRQSVPSEGGGSFSVVLLALLALVIAGSLNGLYYFKLNRDAVQLQTDLAQANADYARLTQVKQRYQELEKQKDAYKKRVDVIDQLRARQAGPVSLLAMVGDTINHTDQVWLNTMNDDGSMINIKGVALSTHAVADLMRNLKNTGYFQTVEIKSSFQDEQVRDLQAFNFELNCTKQASQTTADQPSQPKKS